jgi:alkyl hydroperoxide reductase subunit AhpC
MAKIKPEFDRRGVKIIGLSVDPVDRHAGWAADIKETARARGELSDDRRYRFQRLEALRACCRRGVGDPLKRTPADNQTVRNVFVIGPDKKVKLILVYPMTTGRNFDEVLRVIDSLQMTAKHKVATPVNWKQGEDVIIAGSVSDEDAKEDLSAGLEGAEAVHPHRAATALGTGFPKRSMQKKGRIRASFSFAGFSDRVRRCAPAVLESGRPRSILHADRHTRDALRPDSTARLTRRQARLGELNGKIANSR